jgi:hypothetical protein
VIWRLWKTTNAEISLLYLKDVTQFEVVILKQFFNTKGFVPRTFCLKCVKIVLSVNYQVLIFMNKTSTIHSPNLSHNQVNIFVREI